MIDYTLVRSHRRTAAIHIRDGGVEVRAPMKMPKLEIDRFVTSEEKRITKRLAESQLFAEQRKSFKLNYGDSVTFRGKEYPLTAKTGNRAGFDGEVFFLPPNLAPEQIKPTVVHICRRLAKLHLAERVEYYAGLMNTYPTAVRINGAKTRWDFCQEKLF